MTRVVKPVPSCSRSVNRLLGMVRDSPSERVFFRVICLWRAGVTGTTQSCRRVTIADSGHSQFSQQTPTFLRRSLFAASPTEKQLVYLVEDNPRRRTTASLTQIVRCLHVHVVSPRLVVRRSTQIGEPIRPDEIFQATCMPCETDTISVRFFRGLMNSGHETTRS